jgi:hypothetical protein
MDTTRPWYLRVGSLATPDVPEDVCIVCTNGYKEVTYEAAVK